MKQIGKKAIMLLTIMLCAILVWAMPGSAIAGEKVITTKEEYTIKVVEESATGSKFIFVPKDSAQYVIIHYKVNDGDQQNLNMTGSDKQWEHTVDGVKVGDTIKASFTYNIGAQYDSDEVSHEVGTALESDNKGNDAEDTKKEDSNNSENNEDEQETVSGVRIEAESYTRMYGAEKEDTQLSKLGLNDWARYQTNVREAGKFHIVIHGKASEGKNGKIVLRDQSKRIAEVEIPAGGSDLADYKSGEIELSSGKLQLTAVVVAGEMTVDWFEIEPVNSGTSGDNNQNNDNNNNNGNQGGDDNNNNGNQGDNNDQNNNDKQEPSAGSSDPTEVEKPEFDTSIPKRNDKIIFQLNNRTNGAYKDNQIYWCILGYRPGSMELCYVNEKGELKNAHTGLNTIKIGDRTCADIFNTLEESKYVYMPSIVSGRMYISYGSPVYITINKAADGRIGFAGPDMNNTSDPNRKVYFEFMEFTIGSGLGTANENPVEYWGNTTRVDNFCFPVVTRLIGENGSTNGIHYDNYDKTVGDVGTREEIYKEFKEKAPKEFKDLAEEYRIVAPCKGSFNEGKANANYFKDYIDQFWKKFAKEDLKFECQGGNFVARVKGDYIEFTEKRSGQTGKVKKPNTQEVLEGKGAFDSGSSIEKVFEAQLCAAFNRGVALNPEHWYTPEKYYQSLPYNYYSKFWHEHGVGNLAYGFCYDDVHEQATLLHFTNPKALVIDLKW